MVAHSSYIIVLLLGPGRDGDGPHARVAVGVGRIAGPEYFRSAVALRYPVLPRVPRRPGVISAGKQALVRVQWQSAHKSPGAHSAHI